VKNKTGWVAFVALRYFHARKSNGGRASSVLAALGIAVGTATLIVVIGVMNGFQTGFIDSILEVDSYHLRVTRSENDIHDAEMNSLTEKLRKDERVLSAIIFADYETVALGKSGRSLPLRIKALPEDIAAAAPRKLGGADFRKCEPVQGVQGLIFFPDGKAASRNDAKPSPFRISRFKDFCHDFPGWAIAVLSDPTGVLVGDLVASFPDLLQAQENSLDNVHRLKTGDHSGPARFGNETVGLRPRDDADMAGTEKTVDVELGISKEGADRRRDGLVNGKDGEICQSLPPGAPERSGHRRRRRFKSDSQENHFPGRILLGEGNAVQRRRDHADIGALRANQLQTPSSGTRNAEHIAEGGEDDIGLFRQHNGAVHVGDRRDTDGASRTGDQADALGKESADSKTADGMGMGPADFHESDGALHPGSQG